MENVVIKIAYIACSTMAASTQRMTIAAIVERSGICEVGDFGDEMFNRRNKAPILHIPC